MGKSKGVITKRNLNSSYLQRKLPEIQHYSSVQHGLFLNAVFFKHYFYKANSKWIETMLRGLASGKWGYNGNYRRQVCSQEPWDLVCQRSCLPWECTAHPPESGCVLQIWLRSWVLTVSVCSLSSWSFNRVFCCPLPKLSQAINRFIDLKRTIRSSGVTSYRYCALPCIFTCIPVTWSTSSRFPEMHLSFLWEYCCSVHYIISC